MNVKAKIYSIIDAAEEFIHIKGRSSAKPIAKGAQGKIVQEINIRLTGFGGGLPSDIFDVVTESKVKQFQKDYMGLANPDGIVNHDTAKKIDEFSDKFKIDFNQLKCNCGCGGFGKGASKGVYREKNGVVRTGVEAYYDYEYPGIHRCLYWAVKGLQFYLTKDTTPFLRFLCIIDGYRCHKKRTRPTSNHLGKAVDIHLETHTGDGKWHRDVSTAQAIKHTTQLCDHARQLCQEKMKAAINWTPPKNLGLEHSTGTSAVATTWVHIDVREYGKAFLDDSFFVKTENELIGHSITTFLSE